MLARQTAAGGAADLNSLELLAVADTAADAEDDFPQGGTHGNLDQAGVLNVTGQGKGLGAGGGLGADLHILGSAVLDDGGHVGKGLHVVQDGGLVKQAVFHSTGRLDARHTALTFDRSSQGRTLAANESAGAAVDVHMEGEVSTQNVVAQQTQFFGLGDGVAQTGNGHGILSTNVDVTLGSAAGDTCDHHTLDHTMGVTLHDGAVHKGTGVAFVAVTNDILGGCLLTGHLTPLGTGRETAAAAAAQVGVQHFLDDVGGLHLKQSLFQSGIAADGQILQNGVCIHMAAVLQNLTGLTLIEGDLFLLFVDDAVLLIGQALHGLALNDGRVDDLVHIGLLDLGEQPALRLDTHQGAHLAEAMAAGLLQTHHVIMGIVSQFHFTGDAALFHLGLQSGINVQRAAGDTTGTGTHQNLTGFFLCGSFAGRTQLLKLLSVFQFGHVMPPSAAERSVQRPCRGSLQDEPHR